MLQAKPGRSGKQQQKQNSWGQSFSRALYNVRGILGCVFACFLWVGGRAAREGNGIGDLLGPHNISLPPSLSARPFTLPHSVTHLTTTVTATAEYDGCPIITDDTVLPRRRHGTLIFFCVMCPTLPLSRIIISPALGVG